MSRPYRINELVRIDIANLDSSIPYEWNGRVARIHDIIVNGVSYMIELPKKSGYALIFGISLEPLSPIEIQSFYTALYNDKTISNKSNFLKALKFNCKNMELGMECLVTNNGSVASISSVSLDKKPEITYVYSCDSNRDVCNKE